MIIQQYSQHSQPTCLRSRNVSLSKAQEQVLLDSMWLWCPQIESHANLGNELFVNSQLYAPAIDEKQLLQFPYHYSTWKSSSLLPRRISPCEHYLLMHLLMIIKRLCRENNITFAMSDGTLLGSWRHHDIIPWDDDVDLMVPIEDQLNFLRALEKLKDTVVQYYLLEQPLNNEPYAKVFFQYAPCGIQTTWTFPFVDIFFYFTNDTHLWYSSHPTTQIELQYIFPLMMRPFGSLWLPAPRHPQHIFKFDAEKECNSHWHDHRKERRQTYMRQNCSDLIDVYPFVRRNQTHEILFINRTAVYTLIYAS